MCFVSVEWRSLLFATCPGSTNVPAHCSPVATFQMTSGAEQRFGRFAMVNPLNKERYVATVLRTGLDATPEDLKAYTPTYLHTPKYTHTHRL